MDKKTVPMPATKGIGGHQSASMKTDEWLTDPAIITALGPFDLDPCSPVKRPWDTAKVHYTKQDNGLIKQWFDRVWLNPPYSRGIIEWMRLMAHHGHGTALIFARTETKFFQQYVFAYADSVLFLDGRLHFYSVDGIRAKANAGAPSVLVAYGKNDVERLGDSGLKGHHQLINSVPVIVVGISPTWKSVVGIALSRMNGTASLNEIYDLVEQIAPDKVANNSAFKEKVRQQLQYYFTRISKGKYTA